MLSTGRAGSRTISNLLSQTTDALCLHEPVPYLVEETAAYRYGDLDLNSLVTQMRETRPLQMTGRTYGESNNRLALAVRRSPKRFRTHASSGSRGMGGMSSPAATSGAGTTRHGSATRWERNRLRRTDWERCPPRNGKRYHPLIGFAGSGPAPTNSIRDDLSALDSDRWQLLRLEDLNAQRLGALAEFGDFCACRLGDPSTQCPNNGAWPQIPQPISSTA